MSEPVLSRFVEDGVSAGVLAVSCGKPTGVSGRLPDWVVGVEADRLLSCVSVASEGAVVCVGALGCGPRLRRGSADPPPDRSPSRVVARCRRGIEVDDSWPTVAVIAAPCWTICSVATLVADRAMVEPAVVAGDGFAKGAPPPWLSAAAGEVTSLTGSVPTVATWVSLRLCGDEVPVALSGRRPGELA